MFVRSGSMILLGDCPPSPVAAGDVALIAPNVLVGSDPEGRVDVTMLLIDADYLIEHLFWQHLDAIPDRDAARDLAAKLYPDPVQVLRLGQFLLVGVARRICRNTLEATACCDR
ncbi:hypothetical protein [Micropruina sp.]|uniref:hypothetical protein n=1 Tax=Micropruina sp. TaxID=2737536 RepID=UPI0039E6BEAD